MLLSNADTGLPPGKLTGGRAGRRHEQTVKGTGQAAYGLHELQGMSGFLAKPINYF